MSESKVPIRNLCRKRGDTHPWQYTLKDTAGAVVDITGASFLKTIDPAPDPVDSSNNLFQLVGVIVDAPNGVFKFTPSAANMDQLADVYFHDIQMTDASAADRTIQEGQFQITTDITK